ncbi:hypothetical protein NMG60_11018042 [Bertholletia excelsa]
MESMTGSSVLKVGEGKSKGRDYSGYFQMPLHYPKYHKSDYETMPEWKLDRLLSEYGLPVSGDLQYKRTFAMGAFLWSSSSSTQ